ncbi:alanine--tRNA ligase [Lutimonas sp.]|uniref:alanine--tRNA ligase n=1 Tax=Lutimonas sp. TaxID=1872403 RepID=UPI003D9BAD39
MTSQEIRKQFLNFFASKKHEIVQSAPLVNKNDPSLMFVNAGMNPFKEFFLGQKDPVSTRITDTQKCLRVSGKHNDLEEVGMDTYHHTMFEMLGNWSFGDYFKEEAITWAWELLTEVFKIDKENLYVTVFEGDKDDRLEFDQEAHDFWLKHIPADRILKGNKKDNFWEMGAQGPCGPCSEIHVDIRSEEEKKKVAGKDLVNMDHPLVIEIWNLVFMEFNRRANGSLEKLPQKHVDTGMGFERLCMVIQKVQSNYDTDVFTPIIREIETITNNSYGKNEKTDIAIRVIADHVRAVAFAIADGQLPSNNGAGYVIRRILRRAIRYGFTFLNKKEPFIYQLADVLESQMGENFPEIKAQKDLIHNVIKEEEHSFLRTLDQGLLLLDNIVSNSKSDKISGKKAFELYDTYGFPKDLTSLILREKGMEFDELEFEEEMAKQKSRSRAAAAVDTDDWHILIDDKEQEFIGYDYLEAAIKISRYRKVSSKKDGDMYQLVFNMTPFYPEGGGQVGDKGYLELNNGNVIYILDTKKENNLILHYAKSLPEDPSEKFKAVVDSEFRSRTMSNHTATHLLHQALRTILGTHVEQKGSLVNPKYLRFDFSHFSKLSAEEVTSIEQFVNARIQENIGLVENRQVPLEEAKKSGAIMLFGEKYGDAVRTINFGQSTELCGGTHVKNTADIWHFKIMSESAIASGIRRIEAITNDAARDYYFDQDEIVGKIKSALKNPSDLLKSITSLQEDNNKLKKEIEQLNKLKAASFKDDLIKNKKEINDINFISAILDTDAGSMKNIAFEIGNEVENLFFIGGSKLNGKALLTVYISKNIVESKGLNAGTIIRELGKHIQGGGGGQAFFATAGGKNPEGLQQALTAAEKIVAG